MSRRGVSGWMFLLVPAHPGSRGQRAVKRSCVLLTYFLSRDALSESGSLGASVRCSASVAYSAAWGLCYLAPLLYGRLGSTRILA